MSRPRNSVANVPDASPAAIGTPAGRAERTRRTISSERRDHLVRLAAELFARQGFQATTVRQIAKEAGILSGSLYHHFDSKESIVDEVLSRFLDDLIGRYQAVVDQGRDVRTTLTEMIRICFGALEPHRAAIMVMQNDWGYLRSLPGDRFGYLVRAEETAERLWLEQIKRGQAEGVLRADLDPRLTYRMIRDAIWVTVRWFRPDGPLDTARLAEHYTTVLFDGLAAGPRAGRP